jgi:hypothetical protein
MGLCQGVLPGEIERLQRGDRGWVVHPVYPFRWTSKCQHRKGIRSTIERSLLQTGKACNSDKAYG